jgi:hypothetical protein
MRTSQTSNGNDVPAPPAISPPPPPTQSAPRPPTGTVIMCSFIAF